MVKQGNKTGRSVTDTRSPNDRPKQKNRPSDPAAELCRLTMKTSKNSSKNVEKTVMKDTAVVAPPLEKTKVPPCPMEDEVEEVGTGFKRLLFGARVRLVGVEAETDERSIQTGNFEDTIQNESAEEFTNMDTDIPLTQVAFESGILSSDEEEVEVVEEVLENEEDEEGNEDEDQFDAEKLPAATHTRPIPKRRFSARYDFKIKLPPSDKDDMILTLNEMLQNLWEKIKELDKTTVLYPWAEGSTAPSIRVFEAISKTSLSDIRTYFHRSAPREKGGFNYFSAYLGHDLPFQKLQEDLEHWMFRSDVQAGWWYRPLQCEETLKLGWLFGSVREMDVKVLAAEIKRKSGVTVGLRFKTIAVARGVSLGKDDMIQAIHVEIDTKDEKRRTVVENLYSAKRKAGFPLGIKMRLVSERSQLSSTISLAKWDRARNHQNGFINDAISFDDAEISVLDYKDPGLGNKTLRQVIMAIRSVEYPSKPLFVSVDRRFKGVGVRFMVRSKLVDEADARINGGILSFLRATLEESMHTALDKCFSPRAVSRAESAIWDPINNCVVAHADRMMADFDDILKDDFSIDSEDLEKDGKKNEFVLDLDGLKDRLTEKKNAGQEFSAGDSLSTFRNAAERRREANVSVSESSGKSSNKTRTKSAVSSVTTVSGSAATISRLEKDLTDMRSMRDSDMGRLQQQFDVLAGGLNQLTQVLLKQNNASQPADSQGAVAGHDK